MRRSEQRESEIAQLVEEGTRPSDDGGQSHMGKRSVSGRKFTDRNTLKSSQDIARDAYEKSAVEETHLNETTRRWTSPRLRTEPHRRSASYMSSAVDPMGWNQFNKHSGARRQETSPTNRSMSTSGSRRSLDVHPDLGNEYIQNRESPLANHLSFDRPQPSEPLEKRSASLHTRRQSMPGSSRNMLYSDNQSTDLHTQNLYAALQHAEKGPNSESPILDSLGHTARLADTLNQGLRQAIRASLEARMSLTLSPSLESMEYLLDTLNMDLSQLLKQSDDHVRSLTDTLMAFDRDQRPVRRSHTWRYTSPPQTALSDTSVGNSSIPEYGQTPSPIPRSSMRGTPQRSDALGLHSIKRPTFSMYEPMQALDNIAAQTKQRHSVSDRPARTSPWTTPIHSRHPRPITQRGTPHSIDSRPLSLVPSSPSLWPQSTLKQSQSPTSPLHDVVTEEIRPNLR
ncbi:hypothetical protein MYAM1_003217 [Malassezia yamatoensis]|uniref:Uncharacterized protein n=1 Tax=Malassezia yamatoensis TaxID=253288 RepID=A0AAJ6CHN0_9BASI|nr:hypothetical protein MYAM1_003217 [Malassezia yamatoensis]